MNTTRADFLATAKRLWDEAERIEEATPGSLLAVELYARSLTASSLAIAMGTTAPKPQVRKKP